VGRGAATASDRGFWLYYGHPAAEAPAATETRALWGSSFVWHG
jgi:hypothetical protein